MKHPFQEDHLAQTRDPIDSISRDFDWKELYRRLNEEACEAHLDQKLAEAVARLLQMLLADRGKRLQPMTVGLRIIALAWVLNPGYFQDSPSLRRLARRCGVNTSTLAQLTGQYSRFLQWRNRAQRHAWNWENPRNGPQRRASSDPTGPERDSGDKPADPAPGGAPSADPAGADPGRPSTAQPERPDAPAAGDTNPQPPAP